MQIVVNLLSGRHIILAGPVGTGKTTLAYLVSQLFWKDEKFEGYYSDVYTATADWNSQDVIGGIMPRIKDNQPTYEMVLGCFGYSTKQLVYNEARAPDKYNKRRKEIQGHLVGYRRIQ